MRVGREQVLRFRAVAQGLAERSALRLPEAAGWDLQDSPPGTAAMALHARVADLPAGALASALADERSLLALYNPRTATAIVPAAEAGAFCAALAPDDPVALEAVLARAIDGDRVTPGEAVELAVGAVREALDGRALSRDDLHQALRERLPAALLPWCPGCQTHHARRGLLVIACLLGELCIAGRAGRQPAFARPADWLGRVPVRPPRETAAAELVRRYLRRCGPGTPGELAEWAGIHRGQARRAWALLEDGLEPVDCDGRRAWVLAADAAALAESPPVRGARLIAPGDPYLLARDRALLVTDPVRRKAVWGGLMGPGALLVDGEIAGTWRARRRGRTVAFEVSPFGALTAAQRDAVTAEAEAAAPHRGGDRATVAFSD